MELMKISSTIKAIIQDTLNTFGWEIIRLNDKVPRDLFDSLVEAYEFEISKKRPFITRKSHRHYLLGNLIGTSPSEAFYIVESIARTNSLGGDVCEFGVAQGKTSALIANELIGGSRVLHLFDSFNGLPAPSDEDELKNDIFNLGDINKYEGKMNFSTKDVIKSLSDLRTPYTQFVIHAGFIADALRESNHLPQNVTFAYIDFDFYEGITDALTFVDQVSGIGTEIIVDDYDFFSSGAKLAVDLFINNPKKHVWGCEVANKSEGHFARLIRIK